MAGESKKKSTVSVGPLQLLRLIHRAIELEKYGIAKDILADAIRQMEHKEKVRDDSEKAQQEAEKDAGETG